MASSVGKLGVLGNRASGALQCLHLGIARKKWVAELWFEEWFLSNNARQLSAQNAMQQNVRTKTPWGSQRRACEKRVSRVAPRGPGSTASGASVYIVPENGLASLTPALRLAMWLRAFLQRARTRPFRRRDPVFTFGRSGEAANCWKVANGRGNRKVG